MHERNATPNDMTREPAGDARFVRTPRRGRPKVSPQGEGGDLPFRETDVAVRSEPCVAIDDAVGCTTQVLVGETWIAAAGAPQGTGADAGSRLPLVPGTRFSVRTVCDILTVSITTPGRSPDVGFSLQQRDGMRVLAVTSGGNRRPASLPDSAAANRRMGPAQVGGRASGTP